MKKMVKMMLLAVLLSSSTVFAGGASWLTDFELAKKEAARKKVPILADFSGSDWCGWCVKLDSEVFSKPAFLRYTKKNLVLFLADFPRSKKQSPKIKKQNAELAKKFAIRGFPTVLLLDKNGDVMKSKDGKPLKTGYQRGGPKAYIKHLKALIKSAK